MIYINFCSKLFRAKVALALSKEERRTVMPTVTADPRFNPNPLERAQMCALKWYIKAVESGHSLLAAFCVGLYRGLRG